MKVIEANLRYLMRKHKVTIKHLAGILDVSSKTVERWIYGGTIRKAHAEHIADIFKVCTEDITE